MSLIFYLSTLSEPLKLLPDVDWGPIDKVYHLAEYTVLGALVAHALLHASPGFPPGSTCIIAWLVVVVYGASDEWHQSFVPGRDPAIYDWVVDSIGGTLGVLIAYLRRR